MGLGLGVLRLPPDAFWRMTPRELAAAAGLSRTAGGLSRLELDALMVAFPDGQV